MDDEAKEKIWDEVEDAMSQFETPTGFESPSFAAQAMRVPMHLRRIDTDRNMARFYTMSVQPNLFGEWCLLREWGRIGSAGRLLLADVGGGALSVGMTWQNAVDLAKDYLVPALARPTSTAYLVSAGILRLDGSIEEALGEIDKAIALER